MIEQWVNIRTRDHTWQKWYNWNIVESGDKHKKNQSFAGNRYTSTMCVFLNIWDNVPMDLEYVCQQYFTYMYMCFLGLIRYNKTFIACGYRKYESLFTHEYHIPLGRFPRGISKLPIKTIQPIKIIVLRHHIYFTILASFIFFFKSSKHFLQVDIEVGMMKT